MAAAISGCSSVQVSHPGRSYIAAKGVEAKKTAVEAYSRGEYRAAREKFMESLRIDRSIQNRSSELDDLVNIGKIDILLGESEAAKYYLYDAVLVGLHTKDLRNLSEAYLSLAAAHRLTGDYAAALDSIDESINIDRRFGALSGAKLNQKGLIFIDIGRETEAAGILKQAVEINRADKNAPEIANSYRAMAELAGLAGRYEEAVAYYASAYDIDKSGGDKRKVALDLERMGDLRAKNGSLKEAVVFYEKSYIVRLNGDQTQEALASLDKLIEAYRGAGDPEKAGFYLKIRAGIIENSVNRKAGTR